MTTTPPTAFVSHASKDQERFVRGFATRLREEGGIDAWYAEWELAPGDSLVDRIFEGINAQAFIVVLSENSISSKWVQEEMNAAFVRKVEDNCRFIPVRLDKVKVPDNLRHVLWIDINDPDDYDKEFGKIRDIIFDIRRKPAVGAPPRHALESALVPQGLTKLDFFLLTQTFNFQREHQDLYPHTQPFVEAAIENGWSANTIAASFKSLGEEEYLYLRYYADRSPFPGAVYLLQRGWELMFRASKENYDSTLKALAVHLASHADDYENKDDSSLAEIIGEDEQFTRHLLDQLKGWGFIDFREQGGGSYYVSNVKVRLSRALDDGSFGE